MGSWKRKFHRINDLQCERNGATTTLAAQGHRTSDESTSQQSVMRQSPIHGGSRLVPARYIPANVNAVPIDRDRSECGVASVTAAEGSQSAGDRPPVRQPKPKRELTLCRLGELHSVSESRFTDHPSREGLNGPPPPRPYNAVHDWWRIEPPNSRLPEAPLSEGARN